MSQSSEIRPMNQGSIRLLLVFHTLLPGRHLPLFLCWQHCRHLEVVPSRHSCLTNPSTSPSAYKNLYGPLAKCTTHLSTTNTNYRLSKLHCLSIVHLTQPLSWLTGELESNKNQQTMLLRQELFNYEKVQNSQLQINSFSQKIKC